MPLVRTARRPCGRGAGRPLAGRAGARPLPLCFRPGDNTRQRDWQMFDTYWEYKRSGYAQSRPRRAPKEARYDTAICAPLHDILSCTDSSTPLLSKNKSLILYVYRMPDQDINRRCYPGRGEIPYGNGVGSGLGVVLDP
jgi:hypothetical protein